MLDFTRVDGRDAGEITLFALSTCVRCRRTRKHSGSVSFPLTLLDGRWRLASGRQGRTDNGEDRVGEETGSASEVSRERPESKRAGLDADARRGGYHLNPDAQGGAAGGMSLSARPGRSAR